MLNQLVLVGRLVEQPTTEEDKAIFTLAVQRPYKNENGEYETDFIKVMSCSKVANNICDYCKKGDVLGVKGRLQQENELMVIAEKVTVLTSRKDIQED